jgi:hypothetical protein
VPLSRPTPWRQTPIATTALPFTIRFDPEGAISVRLSRGRGARGESEAGQRGISGAVDHDPVGSNCPAFTWSRNPGALGDGRSIRF